MYREAGMTTDRSRELECRSSAITLSDMEVFIFPELLYGLVLANIMSPRIWAWRDDPWFAGLEKMKPYRRITRLKQFIMDRYVFNLDLETWGLTRTDRELERFRDFVGAEELSRSNALFGYEGDRYYFDIDIRTHFGLDRYDSDIIPYWKTETVEAMDAFRHKPEYANGAGECVSLAALYAAALFVVVGLPLRDIYLMATPLHSQNFIDLDDGILTNNRRLVTKKMWFNGTALSAQARRTLENERVTIVAHESGWMHTLYDTATIDPEAYAHLSGRLREYLVTDPSAEILGHFLRHAVEVQRCFQLRWHRHGADCYLPAERAFAWEPETPYLLTDSTRSRLLGEIDAEEFVPTALPRRIILDDLEQALRAEPVDITDDDDIARLKTRFGHDCLEAEMALDSFIAFCRTEPRLPDPGEKTFAGTDAPLGITTDMTREEIIDHLDALRPRNATADMAFYAWRDLRRTETEPFLLAAVERSPVSSAATRTMTDAEVIGAVSSLDGESIYDGPGRLAQPDEVWNFGRGDGVEKALLLAGLFCNRYPEKDIEIAVGPRSAVLETPVGRIEFASVKDLPEQTWRLPLRGSAQSGPGTADPGSNEVDRNAGPATGGPGENES